MLPYGYKSGMTEGVSCIHVSNTVNDDIRPGSWLFVGQQDFFKGQH